MLLYVLLVLYIFIHISVVVCKKVWKALRHFKSHFDKLPKPKTGHPAQEESIDSPYFQILLFLKDIFEKKAHQ